MNGIVSTNDEVGSIPTCHTQGGTTNNSALFFYTKKPPKDSETQFDKTDRNQIAETFSTAALVVARFSIWMTSAALRLLLSTI